MRNVDGPGGVTVTLSDVELILLNNALNEALHGVGIEEFEFLARLDGSRDEAARLLARIQELLGPGRG